MYDLFLISKVQKCETHEWFIIKSWNRTFWFTSISSYMDNITREVCKKYLFWQTIWFSVYYTSFINRNNIWYLKCWIGHHAVLTRLSSTLFAFITTFILFYFNSPLVLSFKRSHRIWFYDVGCVLEGVEQIYICNTCWLQKIFLYFSDNTLKDQ